MDTLDMMIKEGRLIRGRWTGEDDDGRATACLLSAMSPATGKAQDASVCPASLMPSFWAHLTVYINDDGTLAHWPDVVRKYADLARRWHVLTAEQWDRLDYRCRAIAVLEARKHTSDSGDLAVIDEVLALLDRAILGDAVSDQEWEVAKEAAREASTADTKSSMAVRASTWAATTAARRGYGSSAATALDYGLKAASMKASSKMARAEEAVLSTSKAAWEARAAAADAAAPSTLATPAVMMAMTEAGRAAVKSNDAEKAERKAKKARTAANAEKWAIRTEAGDRMIDAMLTAMEEEIVRSEK